MSVQDYNPSKVAVTNIEENSYCIVLNIAEGIGFDSKYFKSYGKGIMLKVSLNGVTFEIEGNFTQPNLIIFNSNCIWECELEDVKRIKMENRPVKVECFFNNDYYTKGSMKRLGSLLLPLRGVKILHSLANLQIKPYWYKLSNSSTKDCQISPQIYLMLAIVKKTIVDHIHLEYKSSIIDGPTDNDNIASNVTHTLSMLQSQDGIFVKLLEDVGQIQVGNESLVDCDNFCVTITFRQIQNVFGLLNIRHKWNEIQKKSFVFQYDFLGSISNIEIVINKNDCYTINQKISLNFRSSLENLRLYFQRIFYIPIKLYYMNDMVIAKYRFDISSFLPDDIQYFNEKGVGSWTKCGSFCFDILSTISSPSILPPSVDFMLTLDLITKNAKGKQFDNLPFTVAHDGTIPNATEFGQRSFMSETKVAEYLQLQQHASEKGASKSIHSEASNEYERTLMSNKSVCTVAVNTDDHFQTQESEKLYLYFLQQFKDWKEQQMNEFLNEIASTKQMLRQELQDRCEDFRTLLMDRLETKVLKCDQLFAQLENTQIQLNAIAAISLKNATIGDNITREIDYSYRIKIAQFEKEIQRLKMQAQEKEIENTVLEKRICQLENQLLVCQSLSLDQLKDVLSDMRNQANRFAAMESFYKEKCFNNMKKFQIKMLKVLDDQSLCSNFDVNICLEDIFNEDIITLNSNNIKSLQVSSISSLKSPSSSDDEICL